MWQGRSVIVSGVVKCKVTDLRPGDKVDLEGDPFADELYVATDGAETDHLEFQFEYEAVLAVERAEDGVVNVDFLSGLSIGFDPDHLVEIDAEQSEPVPVE